MARATHELVRGFDQAAATYERGRPEYPPEAVRHLVETLRIGPGRTVVDLGAGTGKFTRSLLPTGARVVAVEPTAGMRAEFHRILPSAELLDGTAEHIPLPSDSVDAVVSAQAFHWFDPVPTAEELHRVLRRGGGLGLIWNLRDEAEPWVAELSRILDARDQGAPRGRKLTWKPPFESTGRFTPFEYRAFRQVQRANRETIRARVRSVSFIAVLPPAEQEEVDRELQELLDRAPATRGKDVIELPYRTDVYWAFRR